MLKYAEVELWDYRQAAGWTQTDLAQFLIQPCGRGRAPSSGSVQYWKRVVILPTSQRWYWD